MVISYMGKGSEAALEQRLDKDAYNDEELISIKTTLNLPYYASSPEFERAYGSITIEGVSYQYVKKRVYKDILELLCLPNAIKTKLQGIENDLTKSSADGQTSSPVKKGASAWKLSLPDFCQALETVAITTATLQRTYHLTNERFISCLFIRQQERPPQA